ncbi:MAG: antibiotic biosynthesis monooxygenase [Crocinitomicaceae bacterium]|nr:antibiotic biosynthesis monooxygenase [Crocinitomicaceae bacterium]
MITRIVKLQFQEDKIQEFLDFFETVKHKVNAFPGCKGMRLVQDNCNRQTIMTISDWETEAELNAYRDSETFGQVWPKIKPWFEKKPEAWTTKLVFNGFP